MNVQIRLIIIVLFIYLSPSTALAEIPKLQIECPKPSMYPEDTQRCSAYTVYKNGEKAAAYVQWTFSKGSFGYRFGTRGTETRILSPRISSGIATISASLKSSWYDHERGGYHSQRYIHASVDIPITPWVRSGFSVECPSKIMLGEITGECNVFETNTSGVKRIFKSQSYSHINRFELQGTKSGNKVINARNADNSRKLQLTALSLSAEENLEVRFAYRQLARGEITYSPSITIQVFRDKPEKFETTCPDQIDVSKSRQSRNFGYCKAISTYTSGKEVDITSSVKWSVVENKKGIGFQRNGALGVEPTNTKDTVVTVSAEYENFPKQEQKVSIIGVKPLSLDTYCPSVVYDTQTFTCYSNARLSNGLYPTAYGESIVSTSKLTVINSNVFKVSGVKEEESATIKRSYTHNGVTVSNETNITLEPIRPKYLSFWGQNRVYEGQTQSLLPGIKNNNSRRWKNYDPKDGGKFTFTSDKANLITFNGLSYTAKNVDISQNIKVHATYAKNGHTVEADLYINVLNDTPKSLRISCGSVVIGRTAECSATAQYLSGKQVDVTKKVTWSISGGDITSEGTYLTESVGNKTVTATYTDEKTVRASTNLQVNSPSPVKLTVSCLDLKSGDILKEKCSSIIDFDNGGQENNPEGVIFSASFAHEGVVGSLDTSIQDVVQGSYSKKDENNNIKTVSGITKQKVTVQSDGRTSNKNLITVLNYGEIKNIGKLNYLGKRNGHDIRHFLVRVPEKSSVVVHGFIKNAGGYLSHYRGYNFTGWDYKPNQAWLRKYDKHVVLNGSSNSRYQSVYLSPTSVRYFNKPLRVMVAELNNDKRISTNTEIYNATYHKRNTYGVFWDDSVAPNKSVLAIVTEDTEPRDKSIDSVPPYYQNTNFAPVCGSNQTGLYCSKKIDLISNNRANLTGHVGIINSVDEDHFVFDLEKETDIRLLLEAGRAYCTIYNAKTDVTEKRFPIRHSNGRSCDALYHLTKGSYLLIISSFNTDKKFYDSDYRVEIKRGDNYYDSTIWQDYITSKIHRRNGVGEFASIAAVNAPNDTQEIDTTPPTVPTITYSVQSQNNPNISLTLDGNSDWFFEEISGTNFVRIHDKNNPQNALHIENGKLENSEILEGWWSAQWIKIDLGNGAYTLQNRWKSDTYIGFLAETFQASASFTPTQWSVEEQEINTPPQLQEYTYQVILEDGVKKIRSTSLWKDLEKNLVCHVQFRCRKDDAISTWVTTFEQATLLPNGHFEIKTPFALDPEEGEFIVQYRASDVLSPCESIFTTSKDIINTTEWIDAGRFTVDNKALVSSDYPKTKILTKSSPLDVATSLNPFYTDRNQKLKGQCTWYAFGRIRELANQNYLPKEAVDLLYEEFKNAGGRHAKNWTTRIANGHWIKTTNTSPLSIENRKSGMLVVWKTGEYGHVAFVEAVTEDNEHFRVSEFNFHIKSNPEKYSERTLSYSNIGEAYFLDLNEGAVWLNDTPQPTQTTCSGEDCTGKDPEITNCANDAVTNNSKVIYFGSKKVAEVNYRWSPSCQTNWTQMRTLDGQKGTLHVEVQDNKGKFYYNAGIAKNIYSPMIYSPRNCSSVARGFLYGVDSIVVTQKNCPLNPSFFKAPDPKELSGIDFNISEPQYDYEAIFKELRPNDPVRRDSQSNRVTQQPNGITEYGITNNLKNIDGYFKYLKHPYTIYIKHKSNSINYPATVYIEYHKKDAFHDVPLTTPRFQVNNFEHLESVISSLSDLVTKDINDYRSMEQRCERYSGINLLTLATCYTIKEQNNIRRAIELTLQEFENLSEAEKEQLRLSLYSIGLDLTPGVGSLKSAGQFVGGKDLVTYEDVNRWVEAVGLIPYAKIAAIAGSSPILYKVVTKFLKNYKRLSQRVYIDPNGKFSQSEINAAYHMATQSRKVELRSPIGTRVDGGTSDLLVDGVSYDVYTPTTGNADRIISAIAKKNTQAKGIVLDLSTSLVTREQLGNILARVNGAGATNITDIVIIGK